MDRNQTTKPTMQDALALLKRAAVDYRGLSDTAYRYGLSRTAKDADESAEYIEQFLERAGYVKQ